ncbi:MAG: hypothetical protein LBN08_02995 [Lactobacillales bacterium]|nr:hypothetical protein [Lactobacillales bacterium]
MDKFITKLKANYFFVLLSIATVVIYLLFSGNSPLYALNPWQDTNAMYTMGSVLLHGGVPYRDAFEQRGLVLYVIYAIANIFPKYIGLWLIEIIISIASMAIIYKLTGKIAQLFKANLAKNYKFVIAFIASISMIVNFSYVCGGAPEQMEFPLFCLLLLHLMTFIDSKKYSLKTATIDGVMLGLVFWLKYADIGMFVGFFIFIGGVLLFTKNFKKIIQVIGASLAGFAGVSSLVVLYFVITNSLKYMIEYYFAVNMSYGVSNSGTNKFVYVLSNIGWSMANHLIYTGLLAILFGASVFLVLGNAYLPEEKEAKSRKIQLLISLVLMFVPTAMISHLGLSHNEYYFLVFMPFVTVAWIYVFVWFDLRWDKPIDARGSIVITVVAMVLIFATTPIINHWIGEFDKAGMATPQSIFAKKMHKLEKNPTMIQYYMIDQGFFKAAKIIPNHRFFERPYIDPRIWPENVEAQKKYIEDKSISFVVISFQGEYDVSELNASSYVSPEILKNYKVVSSATHIYPGAMKTHILLHKR